MKRLLLIIFTLSTLATALPARAQNILFTAGGGYTRQYGGPGIAATGKLAFSYEYEFNQRLAICPTIGVTTIGWGVDDVVTPDMLFDTEGNRLDAEGNITLDPTLQAQRPMKDAEGNQLIIDGTPMYCQSTMHRTYNATVARLELPLNYYLRTAPLQYVLFSAGPFIDYAFNGKRTTKGDGREAGNRKVGYTDNIYSLTGARSFNVGLKAAIGYQLPQAITISLECDFRLLRNNDITRYDAAHRPDRLNDPFGGHAGRNMSMMLTIGYKLNRNVWKGDD